MLEILPRDIRKIYTHALERSLQHDAERMEIIRKIFLWIIYAKRPLYLHELDEAISVVAGQQSWKEPSIRFTSSTLSKRCGNLIICDEFDGTVSLAHHSVRSFLESSDEILGLVDRNFQSSEANLYLGETCITYLNFTDFQKSLATTYDSKNLSCLNQPIQVAAQLLPSVKMLHSVGLRNKFTSSKPNKNSQTFDVANQLRYIRGAKYSPQVDSTFRLLDYCRNFWRQHCHDLTVKDSKELLLLRRVVLDTSFPTHWQPWDIADDLDPFPYWHIFNWAVHQAHFPILKIWRESVSSDDANGSWRLLWSNVGDHIFSSACSTADLKKIDLFCNVSIEFGLPSGPSGGQLSAGLNTAAALGHLIIVERLFQQKADVNAAAAEDSDRTALQAAAEGGHLAVVERLLQQKADV